MNKQRLFSLVFFGVFVFMLAVTLVRAAGPLDVLSDVNQGFTSGDILTDGVAKYILWILVSLFVFSVAKMLPGMNKKGRNFIPLAIAVLVGFLGIVALDTSEIELMLVSYSALSFVIGGFLPVIILLLFTTELAAGESQGGARAIGKMIIAVLMWLAFGIFAIMKVWPVTFGTVSAPGWLEGLQWVLVIVAFVGVFGMDKWFKLARKKATAATVNASKSVWAKATSTIKSASKAADDTADEQDDDAPLN